MYTYDQRVHVLVGMSREMKQSLLGAAQQGHWGREDWGGISLWRAGEPSHASTYTTQTLPAHVLPLASSMHQERCLESPTPTADSPAPAHADCRKPRRLQLQCMLCKELLEHLVDCQMVGCNIHAHAARGGGRGSFASSP